MNSVTTLIDVTTEYAPLYTSTANAVTAAIQIAGPGVWCDAFTRRKNVGIPPSRAKEKMVREMEVIVDKPQNHIAITANHDIAPPAREPSALVRIRIGTGSSAAPAASIAGRSRMASVSANSSTYPTIADTATDSTIPHGACLRGSCVSSAVCAEASKPVKVHCACNKP